MAIRVHALAKELKLTSKEVIDRLAALKVSAKGPMSTIEDDVADRVRHATKSKAAAKPAAAAPKVATKTALKPKAVPATAVKAAPAPKRAATPAAPVAPKAAPSVAKPAAPKPSKPAPVAPAAAPTAPAAPVAPARSVVAPVSPVAPPVKGSDPVTAPAPAAPTAPAVPLKPVRLNFPISVKDFCAKLELRPNDVIKHLMGKGIFAAINHTLDQATATAAGKEFGFDVLPFPTAEEQLIEGMAPDPAKLAPRAPVVTFMGHVDHGKTSLMDSIRKARVAEGEAGGITQHIGAYEIVLPKGKVTLLDTPGHEAFTALRARGANVTDVVVLVVAADDGVMPQTIEAIHHAKAANVPIIVAINKMDRPDANPNKVQQQLTEHELLSEEWGGKTIMVPVSAKTGDGVDKLLEMLLLEAELLELKADPTKPAQGTVIEASLSKDRGSESTLLVQQGTLRLGDLVVVGSLAGRVRAMINDHGQRVQDVAPSGAVKVLGLPGVPMAGDRFMVLSDERLARQIVERRRNASQQRALVPPKRVTLEDLHQLIATGVLKELKLIIKADVQGSLEAITQSLTKLHHQEVNVQTIHQGVGDISESDVMLAAASDAVVVGFHVGVEPKVQVEAVKQGVDIRIYAIIYELTDAIRAAIEGLLTPRIEETFIGRAEIRRIFQISKVGSVAGCAVIKGTMRRDAVIRVIRGKDRIAETKIANLKRVKDDVREVQEGVECGISLEGHVPLQQGDLIEAWELKKVARKLG